ncbi:muted [Carabus blaptoides fortunei]
MSQLTKDIGEIWIRLFDHRAFLNGAINFVLKEFEQKRSDKEVEYLFYLIEQTTNIKDTQLIRLRQTSNVSLSNTHKNVCLALNTCKYLEDIEQKYQEDTSLALAREDRKLRWEKFVDDMTHKCSRVDNTFDEKEEELHEFYTDLERKLQIGN